MRNITSKIIKEISNKEISVKKNYKLFRTLQKVFNINLNKNDYEDFIFSLEDRDIRTRVFYSTSNLKKIIIFIHGGGWVSGSIESYTNMCIELTKKTNRTVISIDYRLAPEYPYPNGLNDCYEVIKIIMDNLKTIGIKNKDVCLMGDSAGANLVAAICNKVKYTKDFKINKQILIYPSLQSDYSKHTKFKSVIEKGKDYLLTQKQLQEYMSLYIGDSKDINNEFISPLKVRFPFKYPETLIITADNDPLKDEGRSFARKLKLHFNYVEYYNLKGAMHGFLTNSFEKENKELTYNKINNFLGDIYENQK